MTLADVVLCALGALAVGSALMVVSSQRVVRAGLWLVVTLTALAGCFLVLAAELVAWVQLLIYVGAVVVLLLFSTMLTSSPTGKAKSLDRPVLPAALVGGSAAAVLVTLMIQSFGDVRVEHKNVPIGTAERLGAVIFSDWVLAFEVLSIILLAALVATIVVSRRS
jgi:NADH:ubiquinone oxidoreductase subunit 6 (subunit J)